MMECDVTYSVVPAAKTLDPPVHALQARWTASLSMESLYLAFADWLLHLMRSPGKRMDLLQLALDQVQKLHVYLCEVSLCALPPANAVPKEVLEPKVIPLIPVGRLGQPEEVAALVGFVCSDSAAFMTGSNVAMNGGQHMY